jgi:hypothetical protein
MQLSFLAAGPNLHAALKARVGYVKLDPRRSAQ